MLIVDIASFEAALRETLARVVTRGTDSSQFSIENVRSWTAEYLRERNEDLIRFPELRGENHWNLFAVDDNDDDAVFVIVGFATDQFQVLAGRGQRDSIRHFGENFNGDADAVTDNAQQQFPDSVDVLSLPIQQAYHWLECV